MTATREPSVHGSDALRLMGADIEVPLVSGERRRYVNLDYAASAPALQRVRDAVGDLARHELQAAPRRLVVEQDPRRGVHAVGLAVVDGHVVAEDLRDTLDPDRRPAAPATRWPHPAKAAMMNSRSP